MDFELNEKLGTIVKEKDCYEATFVRVFNQQTDTVWQMITNPEKLKDWLAPGSIELRKGGSAKLNFGDSGIVIDSLVSAFESGSLLEYSWSNDGEALRPIRWELTPEGSGTRLTLTLVTPLDEVIDRSCAGWEAHLMMLLAAIEGVPIKFPFEQFQKSRAEYQDMLDIAA